MDGSPASSQRSSPPPEPPGMMPPHVAAEPCALGRRSFLASVAGFAGGTLALAGCRTPLMRGQTPEAEAPADQGPESVGDYTRPWGLNWVKLESVALVTNLPNTGSDPPPGQARQRLI